MRRNKDLITRLAEKIVASLENDNLTTNEKIEIGLDAFDIYENKVEHPTGNDVSLNASIEAAKEKHLDVKKAIKHPGAFHEWCVEHGYEKVIPECIEKGLKDTDPVVRRRARFAKVLLELQKRKKEKAKKKKTK